MKGFSFVTPVRSLNRPNTGKEDDDDDERCRPTHDGVVYLQGN
jgi:hypothetical protein